MQRIRLHNGHTQEGSQLHTKEPRPKSTRRPERCHIDIDTGGRTHFDISRVPLITQYDSNLHV